MEILIQNLTFKCIIGILKSERVTPQKVKLDLSLHVKKNKMYIDYAKVALLVEKVYKKHSFYTVEESLEYLCKFLKAKYPKIDKICIKIIKPQALKNCDVGAMVKKNY